MHGVDNTNGQQTVELIVKKCATLLLQITLTSLISELVHTLSTEFTLIQHHSQNQSGSSIDEKGVGNLELHQKLAIPLSNNQHDENANDMEDANKNDEENQDEGKSSLALQIV